MSNGKKKEKKETIKSPVGTAVFPWLHAPDDKFSGQTPKYKVGLRLDPTNTEHAAFIKQMEERLAAGFEKLKEEDKKNAAKMRIEFPAAAPEVDAEGKPTGYVIVRFSMNAVYTDEKTNKVVKLKPELVDAKMNPLPAGTKIYGGSEIRILFTSFPFAFKNKDVGLSNKLIAVQVVKLVSAGSRASAFGEYEGGYDAAGSYPEEGDDTGSDTDSGAGNKPGGEDF